MKHEVSAKIVTKVLNRKDLEIIVKGDGQKLGELLVSKGNIEWVPSGNFVYKWTMSWKKFAEVMQDQGRKTTLPKKKS